MHDPSYRRFGPPDPEVNSHHSAPGNTMRRLVKIRYRCHLCGKTHRSEYYITIAADDLDEYFAKVRLSLSNPQFAHDTVSGHARLLHEERGDYDLLHQLTANRRNLTRVLGHRIQPESDYTCADCGQTFQNIADHRRHIGIDIHTGRPLNPQGILPLCQQNQNSDPEAPA